MKLDLTTFGNSPAAQYLAQLLNESGNVNLARKIGKVLSSGREVLNDLENANLFGYVSLRTLNRQLDMISQYNQRTATAHIAVHEPHLAHLTVNILEARVKSLKRRAQVAVTKRRNIVRELVPGESVPHTSLADIIDEKTSEVLQERSKAYLARHNKLDTLY